MWLNILMDDFHLFEQCCKSESKKNFVPNHIGEYKKKLILQKMNYFTYENNIIKHSMKTLLNPQ